MDDIRLIVMPYEVGRLRDGVGLGGDGMAVTTEILQFSGRPSSEIETSFDLIRQVATRVRAAVEEGAFPVLLSGSCFAGVGVMAGLPEPSPAVVWLDAHPDFSTPETTAFGYFDGMGVATMIGEAWQAMRASIPGAGPIRTPSSRRSSRCPRIPPGSTCTSISTSLTATSTR